MTKNDQRDMTLCVLFAMVALTLIACVPPRPEPLAIDRAVYVQDTRTGLCFAVLGNAFAGVPCTPRVLARIPGASAPAPGN